MAKTVSERDESRIVAEYLQIISTPRKRGRPKTPETVERKIATVDEAIANGAGPLQKLALQQKKLDLEAEMAEMQAEGHLSVDEREEAEDLFVKVAGSYGDRKGLSYDAWRRAGVPAAMLKRAGIKR